MKRESLGVPESHLSMGDDSRSNQSKDMMNPSPAAGSRRRFKLGVSNSSVQNEQTSDSGSVKFRVRREDTGSKSNNSPNKGKRFNLAEASYFLTRTNHLLKEELVRQLTHLITTKLPVVTQEQYLVGPKNLSVQEDFDNSDDKDDIDRRLRINKNIELDLSDQDPLDRELNDSDERSHRAMSIDESPIKRRFLGRDHDSSSLHKSQVSFEPKTLPFKSKTREYNTSEKLGTSGRGYASSVNRFEDGTKSTTNIKTSGGTGGLKSALRRPKTLLSYNAGSSSENSSSYQGYQGGIVVLPAPDTNPRNLRAEVIGMIKTIQSLTRKRLRDSFYKINKKAKYSKPKTKNILLKRFTEDHSDDEIREEPAIQEESRKASGIFVRPAQVPVQPSLMSQTSGMKPNTQILESEVVEDSQTQPVGSLRKPITSSPGGVIFDSQGLALRNTSNFSSPLLDRRGSKDTKNQEDSSGREKGKGIGLLRALNRAEKKYERLARKAFNTLRRRNDEYNALVRSNKMVARRLVG